MRRCQKPLKIKNNSKNHYPIKNFSQLGNFIRFKIQNIISNPQTPTQFRKSLTQFLHSLISPYSKSVNRASRQYHFNLQPLTSAATYKASSFPLFFFTTLFFFSIFFSIFFSFFFSVFFSVFLLFFFFLIFLLFYLLSLSIFPSHDRLERFI